MDDYRPATWYHMVLLSVLLSVRVCPVSCQRLQSDTGKVVLSCLEEVERAKGFEPSTLCLGSKCSAN